MRKWRRLEFDALPVGTGREAAEEETRRDLLKPIEQLLCDVHEEVHHSGRSVEENTAAALKRMVSLMARVALASDRMAQQMLFLTWALAILTTAIVWLTYFLWRRP